MDDREWLRLKRHLEADGAEELSRVAHRMYEADSEVSVGDLLECLEDYVAQMRDWATRSLE